MFRIILVLITIFFGGIILKMNYSPEKKIAMAEGEVVVAEQNLNTAKDDFQKEVNVFRKQSEQKISNNELSIAEFNYKLANKLVPNSIFYQQTTTDLDNRNKGMNKRLDDYKGDYVITFEPFKTEFNKDMDRLTKAIDAFALTGKEYVIIK